MKPTAMLVIGCIEVYGLSAHCTDTCLCCHLLHSLPYLWPVHHDACNSKLGMQFKTRHHHRIEDEPVYVVMRFTVPPSAFDDFENAWTKVSQDLLGILYCTVLPECTVSAATHMKKGRCPVFASCLPRPLACCFVQGCSPFAPYSVCQCLLLTCPG